MSFLFRISTCSVCKNWTENTWDLSNRRRLYCSRRYTMTKRRLVKKKKVVQSDLSDNNSFKDGINSMDVRSIHSVSPPVTSQILLISTDNTTVVSYINKHGGTHYPNLCVEVWEIPHWCLEHDILFRICHIRGKFNIIADSLSRLTGQTSEDRMVFGSISGKSHLSHAQLSHCGFCFNHKLHLNVSPVPDNQALAIDTLSMNWICPHTCISTNNSDCNQNTSISVQNSSDCSSLASSSLVLRGVTTTCISSNSTSVLSKLTNTSKRKNPTSKSPNSGISHWGVFKQSIRDKKFSQNITDFVSKSRRASTQKVCDIKWVVYSNCYHRMKVNPVSAPLTIIADFLIYRFYRTCL